LRPTYATSKPLISWVKKIVAKLTLYATGGKKIGGDLVIIWRLGSFEHLANVSACFWTSDKILI
jgi:hypothetical protein